MIDIYPVHPSIAPEAFAHFGNQILLGLTKAGENIKETAQRISNGTAVLWTVFDRGRPSASFMTSGGHDENGTYLFVYGLAGRGLWRIASRIDQEIVRHARENGISRIRFYGRKAWARLLPKCKIVGEKDGHVLFERSAAQ